jgi:hypothetical protein
MNKYILPTILILASGGLLYFYIKNKGDKDENTTEENKDNTTSTQSTPKQPKKTTISLSKVLKLGSKGLEVQLLQLYLNGYLKARKKVQLTTDGNFGKNTEIALNWLFKRKQTSLQEVKNFSIAQGLDWNFMKKVAKQLLAQKKLNINIEEF